MKATRLRPVTHKSTSVINGKQIPTKNSNPEFGENWGIEDQLKKSGRILTATEDAQYIMGEQAVSSILASDIIFKPIARVEELGLTAGEKLIQKARALKIGRIVTSVYTAIKQRLQGQLKPSSITVMDLSASTKQTIADATEQRAA